MSACRMRENSGFWSTIHISECAVRFELGYQGGQPERYRGSRVEPRLLEIHACFHIGDILKFRIYLSLYCHVSVYES